MMNDDKSISLESGEAVVVNKPVTKYDEDVEKPLDDLRHASDRTLFTAKTVFPFTFFPDTIIVDYQKISIIKKKFFLTEQVDSINHGDLLHIEVESGPLFSTLKITTKYFSDKPISIQYLNKKHAVRVRDILHGVISARQEEIHISDVDDKRLVSKLEQIGKVDVDGAPNL